MAVKNKQSGDSVAVSIGHFCGCTLNQEVVRFCGYDRRCTSDPEFALSQAKANLRDYIAVGLTEQLVEFFQVLEKLLPNMLKGISRIYYENEEIQNTIRVSKTFSKDRPSEEVLQKLRALAVREYEFYDLVVERFRYQQMKLKLIL